MVLPPIEALIDSSRILIIPFQAASIQAGHLRALEQFNIAVIIFRTQIARVVRRRCGKNQNSSRQAARSQTGAKDKSLLFFRTLRETGFLIVAAP